MWVSVNIEKGSSDYFLHHNKIKYILYTYNIPETIHAIFSCYVLIPTYKK